MTLSRVVERQKVRGRSWIYIASSCGYAVEGCVPFVRPELRGGQTAALDSNAQASRGCAGRTLCFRAETVKPPSSTRQAQR